MKTILLSLMIMMTSQWAQATGSTYCLVENDEIRLEVSLTNARMWGSALVDISIVDVTLKEGSLIIGLSDYTFDLSKDEIPYWYNLNGEMKLGAYVEPQEDKQGNPLDFYTNLSVVIDAKYQEKVGEPGTYEGTYTIRQESNAPGLPEMLTKEYTGKVSCEI